MTITQVHSLTAEQAAQVRALEETCRAAEPFALRLFLSSDLNCDSAMDAFFLLHEGETLAGYLTLFAPDPGLAEVTALVHPVYRRRGIFTRLLTAAKTEAAAHGVTTLLLCHEPVCGSGGAMLARLALPLDRTEYQLELDRTALPPVPKTALTLVRANASMVPALSRVSAAAFEEEDDEEKRRATGRFLACPTVTSWCAVLEGQLVGQVSLNTEGGEGYLCGLCIDPALQGRGLGRALLSLAVREAANAGLPIRLDVDSANARALPLYRSAGFVEKARCNYWRLALG